MKRQIFVLLVLCTVLCLFVSTNAQADAPQPGTLNIAFTANTVSLGEPLIIKYSITNAENQQVEISMGKRDQGWLRMKLSDASGHAITALPKPILKRGGIYSEGAVLDPSGTRTGYVVVSQLFQPGYVGQYHLSLSTRLIYSWEDGTGEKTVATQNFSLPITITAKNPKHLRDVAEGLRQTILHDTVVAEYQTAIKALFSMQDSACQPVWHEIAVDSNLDASRAVEVAQQLANVGSINASNTLAEMGPVAPERWSRTGVSPYDALEDMRLTASSGLKQHIDDLLTSAGISLNHVPRGSIN